MVVPSFTIFVVQMKDQVYCATHSVHSVRDSFKLKRVTHSLKEILDFPKKKNVGTCWCWVIKGVSVGNKW